MAPQNVEQGRGTDVASASKGDAGGGGGGAGDGALRTSTLGAGKEKQSQKQTEAEDRDQHPDRQTVGGSVWALEPDSHPALLLMSRCFSFPIRKTGSQLQTHPLIILGFVAKVGPC